MDKAAEFRQHLTNNPLTSEELRAQQPTVPDLRLKPDIAMHADDATTARDILGRLASEGARSLHLSYGDRDSQVDAVLVPVERYMELVGRSLATSSDVETLPDGRIIPAGLAQADVEQVDPNAPWT